MQLKLIIVSVFETSSNAIINLYPAGKPDKACKLTAYPKVCEEKQYVD